MPLANHDYLKGSPGKTICIATPSYDGKVEAGFMTSMLRLQRVCNRIGVHLRWLKVEHAPVDAARNVLVSMFLETSADVLLFIDSDEEWPVRAVFDCVRAARRYDVVGSAVPQSRLSWGNLWRAANKIQDQATAERELPLVSGGRRCLHFTGGRAVVKVGEVAQVDAVGTGFLAVHRRVFERIAEAHPELRATYSNWPTFGWFLPMVAHDSYMPDDLSFCYRWHQLGGKCWAFVHHTIKHTGKQTIVDNAKLRMKYGMALEGLAGRGFPRDQGSPSAPPVPVEKPPVAMSRQERRQAAREMAR